MGRPDIDISTRVRAKELRFGTVPRVKISFEGEPDHESSTRTERENLPDEVEPDVTYRDLEVRWRARSRIVHPTDPDQLGEAEEASGEDEP
jgi:hypothetical protein